MSPTCSKKSRTRYICILHKANQDTGFVIFIHIHGEQTDFQFLSTYVSSNGHSLLYNPSRLKSLVEIKYLSYTWKILYNNYWPGIEKRYNAKCSAHNYLMELACSCARKHGHGRGAWIWHTSRHRKYLNGRINRYDEMTIDWDETCT